MKKKIAVYPGSFDPITYGHIDIIDRACKIFKKLIVSVFINPNKKTMFTADERVKMLKRALKGKNVEIECFRGLLVDYARKKKVDVVIRGLRAISDLEYEFQIAGINRMLYKNIETVFFMPSAKYAYLSSSMVRHISSFRGDVSKLVPPCVVRAIKKKERGNKPKG